MNHIPSATSAHVSDFGQMDRRPRLGILAPPLVILRIRPTYVQKKSCRAKPRAEMRDGRRGFRPAARMGIRVCPAGPFDGRQRCDACCGMGRRICRIGPPPRTIIFCRIPSIIAGVAKSRREAFTPDTGFLGPKTRALLAAIVEDHGTWTFYSDPRGHHIRIMGAQRPAKTL